MSTIPGTTLDALFTSNQPNVIMSILEAVMKSMARINAFIEAGAEFPDQGGNWRPLQRPIDSISNLDCDKGMCLQLPFYSGMLPGSVSFDSFVPTMSKYIDLPRETPEILTSTLNFFRPRDASDIRFCHMDLHSGNIMVHNGQLSGIVDWEMAGWYTWRLEVLGGIKSVQGSIPEVSLFIEAWQVPSDLENTIQKSLRTIRLAMREYRKIGRAEELRLERESASKLRLA
jgi:hypothetical protein